LPAATTRPPQEASPEAGGWLSQISSLLRVTPFEGTEAKDVDLGGSRSLTPRAVARSAQGLPGGRSLASRVAVGGRT